MKILVLLFAGLCAGCATSGPTPRPLPPPPIEGITVLLEGSAQIHTSGKCPQQLEQWAMPLRDATVRSLRDRGFEVISSAASSFDLTALLTAVASGCDAHGNGNGLVMLTLIDRGRVVARADSTFRVQRVSQATTDERLVDPYSSTVGQRLIAQLLRNSANRAALADLKRRRRSREAAAKQARPVNGSNTRADPRPIVAVFGVEQASAATSSDELTAYLTARLAETSAFRLVPQPRLRRALKHQKLESYRDCYDRACQIELGKALAAQKTLATRVLKVGEQCVTSAILYDLASETTDRARSVTSECHRPALMRSVERIAKDLGN